MSSELSVSGFVVPPGDIDAFCAAVERAPMLEPVACRDNVGGSFTADEMVEGYLRIYAQAIEGRTLRLPNPSPSRNTRPSSGGSTP